MLRIKSFVYEWVLNKRWSHLFRVRGGGTERVGRLEPEREVSHEPAGKAKLMPSRFKKVCQVPDQGQLMFYMRESYQTHFTC